MPLTSRVRQVRQTCGMKADVVKQVAVRPKISKAVMKVFPLSLMQGFCWVKNTGYYNEFCTHGLRFLKAAIFSNIKWGARVPYCNCLLNQHSEALDFNIEQLINIMVLYWYCKSMDLNAK